MNYMVARGRHGRASLLHHLTEPYGRLTSCGRDTSEWSRAYLAAPIPQIYCLQCMRIAGRR